MRFALSVRVGLVFVCLSSALLADARAYACDFCMLAQGISPYMTASGKGITLDVTSIQLDHVYDKATNIDGNGKQEAWLVYSLTFFAPLTDSFTLMETIPYASKTNIDFDGTTNPGTLTSGLGDVAMTGRYTLFQDHTLETTWIGGLLFGFKFPSGSTDTRNLSGSPVDRHALPGTGSIDYDLGASFSYSSAGGLKLTLDADYRISGPGKWDERDHRYGNTLNAALKGFYRVAETAAGASFMPFLGVSGESSGMETGAETDAGYDPGLVNLSSGGTVVFLDFGLYSVFGTNLVASLGFSKAFYRYMNFDPAFDADPAENTRVDLSLTYLF